jgi:glycosyltransferase involved in cell wall biosynthesis
MERDGHTHALQLKLGRTGCRAARVYIYGKVRDMKVSIVIPAYNEEELLPKCLTSVQEELVYTPCETEVIVVNNASTDGTPQVARQFSFVRVVDESRKGLVRARHAGFSASTGDIIANIDADTVLPRGWLRTVMHEFERDEELAALSGPFLYYDLSVVHRILVQIFYIVGYIIYRLQSLFTGRGALLQGGNFVVRRLHLERAGGFDTTIEFYGEDSDIARRMSRVGKVKWTFALPMYTSGRRLAHEGLFKMGLTYGSNHLYMLMFGKPLTRSYQDIRPRT